jgi:glycosyl transferase family 25
MSRTVKQLTLGVREYLKTDRSRSGLHSVVRSTVEAGIPAFLINLRRTPERRVYALRHLLDRGVRAEVLEAVDGKELMLDALVNEGVYDHVATIQAFSRDLSLAEIACTWSHIKVLELVRERSIEQALVFEDDVLLVDGFLEQLEATLRELPSGWGILHLTRPCSDFEVVSDYLVRYRGATQLPVSACAYMVSSGGADCIRRSAFPIRYPADSMIGRALRWGAPIYGVHEPLATQNNVFASDIQAASGLAGRIKRRVKNAVVRLLTVD